jgi:5'-nucleotidase
MDILLTNDDGITSSGIILLAEALREEGHRVFIVAPDADRSAISHSISFLKGPCRLRAAGTDAWSCSGTPVDCVVVACLGGLPELEKRPGLVVSGINRGANIGTDIIYSGTAAAARQGSLCGIPSLALSLVEGNEWRWEMAVDFVRSRLNEMISFWRPETFVNVTIPNTPQGPDGIIPAFPSLRYYNDRIEPYEARNGRYCFADTGEIGTRFESGSDWDAISRNLASMSAVFIHPVSLEEVKVREERASYGGKKVFR